MPKTIKAFVYDNKATHHVHKDGATYVKINGGMRRVFVQDGQIIGTPVKLSKKLRRKAIQQRAAGQTQTISTISPLSAFESSRIHLVEPSTN